MLIAMEAPKLVDTKSSVIRWAYTEVCIRRERRNFSYVSAGLLFKNNIFWIMSYMHFFQDTAFVVHKF